MQANQRFIDIRLAISGTGIKKTGKCSNYLIHLSAMWLNSKALDSSMIFPVLPLLNVGQNANITGITFWWIISRVSSNRMTLIGFDILVEYAWKWGVLQCIILIVELHDFLMFVLCAYRPVHEVHCFQNISIHLPLCTLLYSNLKYCFLSRHILFFSYKEHLKETFSFCIPGMTSLEWL